MIKEFDFTCPGNYRSVAGDKYEAISTKSDYNQYMLLKIRNVGPRDFGSYKCVAQNSLGGTDGVIKLDGEFKSSFHSPKCSKMGKQADFSQKKGIYFFK